MKNVVVFLAFVYGSAFHVVAAAEPAIVLLTTEETQVYQTNNGQVELKERRVESPLPDDMQGRPLQELNDRWRLKAAHVANFLDCGQDVVASEPLKKWTQQRIDELGEDDRWSRLVVKPVNESYVMVSERDGARAVVLNRETGQRLPGSPCGAAVKFARVSPNGRRLAVITEKINKIEFFGKKEVSWSASHSNAWFVQLHQLGAPDSLVTTSNIAQDPLDLMLPNEGNWWLLVAKQSNDWWNPTNWPLAIAGHGTRRSSISLQTYAPSGRLMSSRPVASGVELVEGRLVSPHE
jgi:hypothetical protein